MKNMFITALSVSVASLLFISCNNHPSAEGTSTDTPAVSDNKDTVPLRPSLQFTQVRIDNEVDSSHSLSAPASLRKAKKEWNRVYTNCRLAGNDYNINDFDFLGVGNPKDLGTIIDQENFLSRLPLDTNIFSAPELAQIKSPGADATCNTTTNNEIALNLLFEGAVNVDSLNSDLKTKIESAWSSKKNLQLNVKNWQKAELNTTWLSYYLQNGQNLDKKKIYLKELQREGNLIIAKAIYVKGFTMDINTATALSADIQAKLKEHPSIRIGDLAFQLSLKASSDKVIQASCTGSFIVYGYVMAAKKIE